MSGPKRLVVWTAAVAAAIVALHAAGGGPLATPPLTSATRWRAWLAGQDPVVVGCALARLFALAAGWYLLAVTVCGAALRARQGPERPYGAGGAAPERLGAMVERLTVPPVRRLLATTMTVSLATAGLSATPAGSASRPPATLTPSPADPGPPPPTVTMHRLPDPGPATESRHDGQPEHWSVEPGQCFWSIAEAVLARAGGRPPSDEEVVPYWLRLIEVNRAALADPDNPDLIFPGQVFAVPSPSGDGPALAATS